MFQVQQVLARTFLMLLSAALGIRLTGAQGLHIHDVSRDNSAKEARSAFDDLAKSDQDVFITMVDNVRAIEKKTLEELYKLNQEVVREQAINLPVQKWGEVICNLKQRENSFLSAYNQSLLESHVPTSINTAQEAVANAQKELKDASDAVDKSKKLLNAKTLEIKDLRSSIDQVRSAISIHPKPIKNLKDLQQFQNLATAWNGIQGMSNWITKVEQTKGGPGLQLTILDLAYELQKGEADRLQLEVNRLQDEQAYAERVLDLMVMVLHSAETKSAPELGNDVVRLNGGEFAVMYDKFLLFVPVSERKLCSPYNKNIDPSPTVIESLGKHALSAHEEIGTSPSTTIKLADSLTALSMDIGIAGYQKYLLMEAMIQHLTTQQVLSIERSALNARLRSILISHGLDALSAYYEGGITGADMANIISAAQTIATAVIAGKLN